MIVLWLVACGPAPRTWTPVDAAALQAQLDNPTAERPEPDQIAEELAVVIEAGGDLASLPTALEPVLAEPGAELPATPEGDVVSGTSAFFEVACPGTSGVPDPDFASGLVRLEGPFLVEDGTQLVLGPVYLTLAGCALGASVVDGEMRAQWLPDDQRLLAEGGLEVALSDAVVAWDAVLAVDPTGLRLGFEIPEGTVSLFFDEDVVQAAFADGTATCTRTDPVTCTADD